MEKGQRAIDGPEVELTIVTLRFDARDPEALQSVLAKYVVLDPEPQGCRNIDLCRVGQPAGSTS